MLSTFLGETGYIFFPKLDFYKDQIFFKDIALNFLENKGYKPVYVGSENEAKKFNILNDSKEYPIYFFKTDTSGEKEFEEFYTESEDFHLNKYVSTIHF